jgi:hypothetical protein
LSTFDEKLESSLQSFNLSAVHRPLFAKFDFHHKLTSILLRFHNTAVYLYLNFSADAGDPFTYQRLLEVAKKTMLAVFILLEELLFYFGAFAIDPGSANGTPMAEGHPLTW